MAMKESGESNDTTTQSDKGMSVERIGKIRKTLQGLTTKVVKYIDDNNVFVLIEETKEVKKTNWKTFNKGLVRTDLSKVHKDEDCKCQHASTPVKSAHSKSAHHASARRKSWITRFKQWLLRLWYRIFGL